MDAADGAKRWRFATDDHVVSSPAVTAGMVYVGNFDGYLYAPDATTGREVWRFETDGKVSSSPAVGDGTV